MWLFLTDRFGETAHKMCAFSSKVSGMRSVLNSTQPTVSVRQCICWYCGRGFFNSYALSLHYNSQWVTSLSIPILEIIDPLIALGRDHSSATFAGRDSPALLGNLITVFTYTDTEFRCAPIQLRIVYLELSMAVDGDH